MKSISHILSYSLSAMLLAGMVSCSKPSFTVKGDIKGADNVSVLLEKPDFHGRWIVIDSTRTSSSGSFSLSRPAPGSPEIFRLDLDGRYVYLPVDSTETITVNTSLDAFDTAFSLSGTPQAERMERFEKDLIALPANVSPDSLAAFKRRVYMEYLREANGSIVSYYVLTKTLGDHFLFDPVKDYKYYAAVATSFRHFRPNDPHTTLLEQTTLEAMRRHNVNLGRQQVLEGSEIALLDMDIPDEDGKNVSLSSVASQGRPTVLVFSFMNEPESPAINARLRNIHNRGGINIYQVSVDVDQYAWRDAARNLPWTTVFEPAGLQSNSLTEYNVSQLPAFFIYNSKGELTDRAADLDELQRK
ncbi:MAG: peroxiredoxin family protein, partial [Muribaculaceae bacterium]|nr:peroxiredoxin family protein [Muribaculaceae bacterium]